MIHNQEQRDLRAGSFKEMVQFILMLAFRSFFVNICTFDFKL